MSWSDHLLLASLLTKSHANRNGIFKGEDVSENGEVANMQIALLETFAIAKAVFPGDVPVAPDIELEISTRDIIGVYCEVEVSHWLH